MEDQIARLSKDKTHAFSWDSLVTTFKDTLWEERGAEIGDTVMSIVRGKAGWDAIESFEDMPDGMCNCPHFGVVLEGRIRIVTKEGSVECKAGDIYWQAPPHRVEWLEDSVLAEFSPSEEFWAFTTQAEATKKKLDSK